MVRGAGATDAAVVDAAAAALADGESVTAVADALVRVRGHLFERCKTVLTSERMLVMRRVWPIDYQMMSQFVFGEGSVAARTRLDGSVLLDIAGGDGSVCLHFPRSRRHDADRIRDALLRGAEPEPPVWDLDLGTVENEDEAPETKVILEPTVADVWGQMF